MGMLLEGDRVKKLLQGLICASGFNVTKQTDVADVLGLIRRLRPQDCGKKMIRIGALEDGGYLIPDDLAGIEYCFSPGVSNRSHFEEHLANLGIKSFLADYSVDVPPVSRPEFTFDKKFLGAANRGEYFTLETWKNKYLEDYRGDLILQMDIEGFEYEVLLGISEELLKQFRIIVIEFHFLDRLFDRFALRLISSTFDKLLQDFYVVHIHPNNTGGSVKKGHVEVPRTIEFTFLNKNRASHAEPLKVFPHNLDVDNKKGMSPLPLPRCWYSND